jgi:hypothetical protein
VPDQPPGDAVNVCPTVADPEIDGLVPVFEGGCPACATGPTVPEFAGTDPDALEPVTTTINV